MSTVQVLTSKLQENPHTYAHDLNAVAEFIDGLSEPFSEMRRDVFIANAAIQLNNASGYPVGHLTWDSDNDAFIFVPASAEEVA